MIVVFAGPTISFDDIRSVLGCKCLPPVKHGDILQLDLKSVSAIGIVDGYFEGAPSVWHKEILYAMDQGVPVYGASSMGALRAAELHAFGMRGVGQIFEWYRDLVIEDDDEVAVLHGPEEVGYAVASEPMVSIRETLRLALEAGVIDVGEHDGLIGSAKSTFYKERSWKKLLEGDQWLGLSDWVRENRVDLKKRDAVQMLRRMLADRDSFETPFETDFSFEWTNVWDAAFRSIRGGGSRVELSREDLLVLDQLKLLPERYSLYFDRALLSWLTRNSVDGEVGGGARDALKVFRERCGLTNRVALLAYMEKVGLDEAGLERLMEREGLLMQARDVAGDLSEEIVGQLRLDGFYLALLVEAESKVEALRVAGVSVEGARVKRGSYLVWYFEGFLGVEVPEDLGKYFGENGFLDGGEFDRIVVGEYLYQRGLVVD